MVISNFLYFFENSSLFLKKSKHRNNIKISNKIKFKLINKMCIRDRSNFAMALITIWYCLLPGFTSLIIIHGLYGIFSIATFWSPYLKAVRCV